ncbi:hypothetical protein [Brachybacterium tyrofermentans]|uniref:hypothetical protein n=1 Tax=Brachybacterium tyrofermentans TaxID=47848 RepID=UPI003FD469A2
MAVGSIGQTTALAFVRKGGWAPALVMIAVSVLMMLTALCSYEGMYWVSLISTPLILIFAFWITGKALAEVGGVGGLFDIAPTATMTWAAAVPTVVGTFASASTQAATP